jgi:hypothetical protein
MKSNPDIKKVVRQHAEMAEFFSGGLTVKKTSLVARDSSLDKKRVPSHEERGTIYGNMHGYEES